MKDLKSTELLKKFMSLLTEKAENEELYDKFENREQQLNLSAVMLSLPSESDIHKQYPTDKDDIYAPFWDTEHIIHENSFKKEGAMWLLNKIKAIEWI